MKRLLNFSLLVVFFASLTIVSAHADDSTKTCEKCHRDAATGKLVCEPVPCK